MRKFAILRAEVISQVAAHPMRTGLAPESAVKTAVFSVDALVAAALGAHIKQP